MGVGGVWPPFSSGRAPREKCQNGAGVSVLDNLQLNNSLTQSNFRYFTFSWENIKIRPPGDMRLSLKKSFTLPYVLTLSGVRGTRSPVLKPMNTYTASKHDESILLCSNSSGHCEFDLVPLLSNEFIFHILLNLQPHRWWHWWVTIFFLYFITYFVVYYEITNAKSWWNLFLKLLNHFDL